jgi:molybdopterin-guanine dinucleotide biosynthesis protein A
MEALVTAGGVNRPEDPLFQLTGVEKKALIPLAGKPMVTWVIEALHGSGIIDNIVIVGLKPDDVDLSDFPVHFVDPVGGLIDNILAALARAKEINPAARKMLLVSSDIPLITPEIVRGYVEECGSQEADIYYTAIEQKTMEARFPDSKRTFIPFFKGGKFSGGDMFLADVTAPDRTDIELFRSLTSVRKNYFKQARLAGFGFIFRFLLRMMTLDEAAERIGKIINLEVRAVDSGYAELGMDLDKPHQYEMIKAILEERQAQTSGQPG